MYTKQLTRSCHGTSGLPRLLTIRVNVAAIKCPLRSLDFVTLKIKDAVCDKFREILADVPAWIRCSRISAFTAFWMPGNSTLYLDTSGDALFKRGYQKKYCSGSDTRKPRRWNLASDRLAAGIPLLDPMCGSGTFLLEAAQIALNIAPGSGRRFAFEKLKKFDEKAMETAEGSSDGPAKAEQRLSRYSAVTCMGMP